MPERKRVEWDEANLASNAQYQRDNPVTKHIDEPKTPYVYPEDEDRDENDSCSPIEEVAQQWDENANRYAHQLKEKLANDTARAPVAPISQSGRPALVPMATMRQIQDERQQETFRKMRKAVYADEGKRFKELLAHHDDEDEDTSSDDS